MSFEHEKIHLETSSVLMRQLPVSAVVEPPGWRHAPSFDTDVTPSSSSAYTTHASLLSLPTTTVTLGKPSDFPSFGWDNEYGRRTVEVPAFSASPTLVTNADFLPFVEGGGYADSKWWIGADGDDEGLRWKAYRNATHPSFWVASAHPDMARFIGGKPGAPYQKDDGSHETAGSARVWQLRAQFKIIPMPWDWPAEVNYLEAAAFLRWKAANEKFPGVSYRMPTEAECHVLRGEGRSASHVSNLHTQCVKAGQFSSQLVGGRVWKEGDKLLERGGMDTEAMAQDVVMNPVVPGNLNWRWHSPSPVTLYPPSPTGAYDTSGNVWQWLEDHFSPLPGFELHYLYDDFSSPCFDGWHTMIFGGSWVSSGNLASSFARYHFRRHFFQHLGFRYVKVETPEPYPGASTVANLWEGTLALSKELTNGYFPSERRSALPQELLSLPSAMAYPKDLATLAIRAWVAHGVVDGKAVGTVPVSSKPPASALHLGCSVGRGTFELCAHFDKVVGVDNSEPAIRYARILQHHGQFEYERQREGVLTTTTLVTVPDYVDRSRAVFVQADAAAIGGSDVPSLGPFQICVFDGILTRLRFPRDALSALSSLVAPGGLLIVTSNNDWQANLTPRNSWIGGFKMNGEDQSTLTMLTYSLKSHFEHVETADLLRACHQNERKMTVDIMQASVWRRRL